MDLYLRIYEITAGARAARLEEWQTPVRALTLP